MNSQPVPVERHHGYTLWYGRPTASGQLYCAVSESGDTWFEGPSLTDLKRQIDEALEGA